VADLGKTAIAMPVYFSLAWTMLITYQTFTKTAVVSVVQSLNPFLPVIGSWMSAHMDLVEFIHVMAWIFVLTSMIPGVLIGRKRGVLVQFFCTLVLSLIALSFADFLSLIAGRQAVEQMLSYAFLLNNPLVAWLYLSLPYLLMLAVDLYGRRKSKKVEREEFLVSDGEAEKTEEAVQVNQACLKPFAT
jgi:hypothetical protein